MDFHPHLLRSKPFVIVIQQKVSELRSLLAMATYCARFTKDYSSLVHSLRELTKQGLPWSWGIEEQTSLDKLNQALASDTCLSFYFNPERTTEIYVDASPTGLSGILVQTTGQTWSYMIIHISLVMIVGHSQTLRPDIFRLRGRHWQSHGQFNIITHR